MQSKENLNVMKGAKIMLLLSISYLVISFFVVGFKTDQLVLIFIINFLFFFSQQSKRIVIICIPYIIFWILFDYMKAFPNYEFSQVSIRNLYETEKNLFGFIHQGKIITPNEYFAINNNKTVDTLSGFFYLSWVTVPIFLTIYFFYKRKEEAIHLPFAFLLVNLVGFVLYYVYPAAPPWYVAKYGFEFFEHTPGSSAGLARFDEAMGTNLFHSMYEKSSNVFAAMPSLHSAYPVVALYFALRSRLFLISFFILLTAVGIWFSAVYTSHHYVLDVFAGISCAIVGIVIYEVFYKRQAYFQKLINHFNTLVYG